MKKIKLFCVLALIFTGFQFSVTKADLVEKIIDDNDAAIVYSPGGDNSGGWGSYGSGSPDVTEHWTNSVGAWAEISFTGVKFELWGKKAPNHHKFTISIDGGSPVKEDAFSPTKVNVAKLYESPELSSGDHVAKIVMLDERNEGFHMDGKTTSGIQFVFAKSFSTQSGSTGGEGDYHYSDSYKLEVGTEFKLPLAYGIDFNNVSIENTNDEVAVINNGIVQTKKVGETEFTINLMNDNELKCNITVIDQISDTEDSVYLKTKINSGDKGTKNEQFEFRGKWGTDTGVSELYKGDGDWSESNLWGSLENARNNYYNFKFTGVQFEIFSQIEPPLGIQEVYVDGNFYGYIDLYSDTKKYRSSVFKSSILEDKEHIVKVVNTGTKNPNATRYSGFVDYIEVTKRHKKIWPSSISFEKHSETFEMFSKFVPAVKCAPQETNQRIINYIVDEDYVNINEDGSLTFIKEGETEIVAQAKLEDGSKINSDPLKITITKGNRYIKLDFSSSDAVNLQDDYDKLEAITDKEHTVTVWRNDVANAALVMLTKEEAVNATVSVTSFVSESGAVLAENSVKANFQKYVPTYMGNNWIQNQPKEKPAGYRKMIPDLIYGPKIDVEANSVQPIWIEMNIPGDTPAGMYTGYVEVALDNGEKIKVKQMIEVLNIELLSEIETGADPYHFELWQYPHSSARYYGVEAFSDEHFDILRKHTSKYSEIGGVSGTASIVEEPWNHQTYDDYPSMVKWKLNNDKLSFDFSDFDKWVNFQINEMNLKYIACFSMVPWKNQIGYTENGVYKTIQLNPGSPQWKNWWSQFLDAFISHLDEKKWFDYIMISMDERSASDMRAVLDLVESKRNKEGNTLKISGAFNAVHEDVWDRMFQVTPWIGTINGQFDRISKISEKRKAEGKITTAYSMINDYPGFFSMSYPSETAWTIWIAEKYGLSGFLRWSYDAWVEDPIGDNAYWYFEAGDTFIVYPGERRDVVPETRTTPRFERLGEAIRDIKKLRQLEVMGADVKEKTDSIIDGINNYWGQGLDNGIGSAGFSGPRNEKIKEGLDDTVETAKLRLVNLTKEIIAEDLSVRDTLNKNIKIVKEMDLNRYTNTSKEGLNEKLELAISGINNVNITTSQLVQLNLGLERSIQSLVIKEADYSKVNAAIEEAKNYNAELYLNYTEVQHSIDAIVREKNIDEQREVNAMEKGILEAIKRLKKKPIIKGYSEFEIPATAMIGEELIGKVVKAKVEDLLSVYVNGVKIVKNSDYKVSEGSIIIIFTPEFMSKLEKGKMNVEVVTIDAIYESNVNVKLKQDKIPSDLNGAVISYPKTGDNTNRIDILSLFIISLVLLLSAIVRYTRGK